MSVTVSEKSKVSHFLVFYLISSMQIGIGVLGYQRIIAETAGYDAWIAVILAGVSIHIIIWMMFKIAETSNGDLISAHSYIIGEKLGKAFSFIFLFYFILLATTVLRTYIEVVQVWMFPNFKTFWFSLAFLLLTVYIIFGGFRTVTGIAFLGTILPMYLVFTFAYTVPFATYENLLPVFDHTIMDLLKASKNMTLTYLGYETLLFYYPYIKEPKRAKKWAHFAILATTSVYTLLTFITFSYFSEAQLEQVVWATLTMWKIVRMPFVERFEYIGIANWCLIILPNICIAIWCASRILKRTTNIKQSKGVILVSLLCLISINFFRSRQHIEFLNNLTANIGFYFNYFYIPALFAATFIAKKVKRK
jgi:spore germination protein AB